MMLGQENKLWGLLEEIEDLQRKIFQLVKEQKHKESAEELEKILHKFQRLLFVDLRYDLKLKGKILKLKTLFSILKRYYELMLIINNEANKVSVNSIEPGTLVKRKE